MFVGLHWTDNNIGDEGAKAIAEALKVFSGSLNALDLSSACPTFGHLITMLALMFKC